MVPDREFTDGEMVAVGLLPSHCEGAKEFRLSECNQFEGACRGRRETLLRGFDVFGAPAGDPAFWG